MKYPTIQDITQTTELFLLIILNSNSQMKQGKNTSKARKYALGMRMSGSMLTPLFIYML